jgi:hypothetical protein
VPALVFSVAGMLVIFFLAKSLGGQPAGFAALTPAKHIDKARICAAWWIMRNVII